MDPLSSSHELPASAEPAEVEDVASEAGEGPGLGALLVVAAPFALAAWVVIGVAVFRAVT